MKFFARIWTTVTTITNLVFFPLEEHGTFQQPIGDVAHTPLENAVALPQPPFFKPPGTNIENFKCDYTAMGPDWVDCSQQAGCWLNNTKTGKMYNVTTDYESDTPIGIRRNYTLNVTDGNLVNIDGINFTEAKLFNNTFPGPLIEACWGDTINITVINKSQFNGTSIHWHGIRQNQTMHMDGVNGITQCPIAPGDTFSYIWNVTQYGSSWYHSHYSVQYADGLQGPITLHGPTSAPYDDPVDPLLTSDWLHNSAFAAMYPGIDEDHPTILLNGTGNCTRSYGDSVTKCNATSIPKGYEVVFNPTPPNPGPYARKYLLRIINTSFSTQITFSIDNHYLTVVEADFVPVQPSQPVTSILVAIGQRYHVIVEAKPTGTYTDGNYWIRTNTSGCDDDANITVFGFERTGILRYNSSSTAEPKSLPWPDIPQNCTDVLSTQLEPAYTWNVTAPKNGPSGEAFQVNFNKHGQYATARFALTPSSNTDFTPFRIDYGNPTFLNLDNFDNLDPEQENWPIGWVVIPENYTSDDYVYFKLSGGGHPIHLHGHDFAVLDYSLDGDTPVIKPYYFNPMRRDVVLLPEGGYVLIAFKTDNPGAWLMHCHIAFHASGGLSLQVMERQTDANIIWPPGNSLALTRARRTCAKWNSWAYDCRNYWPGEQADTSYPACVNATMLQNDSGV